MIEMPLGQNLSFDQIMKLIDKFEEENNCTFHWVKPECVEFIKN